MLYVLWKTIENTNKRNNLTISHRGESNPAQSFLNNILLHHFNSTSTPTLTIATAPLQFSTLKHVQSTIATQMMAFVSFTSTHIYSKNRRTYMSIGTSHTTHNEILLMSITARDIHTLHLTAMKCDANNQGIVDPNNIIAYFVKRHSYGHTRHCLWYNTTRESYYPCPLTKQ